MSTDNTIPMYHPTFPDVAVQVGKNGADEWSEQGWRKTPLTKSSESGADADKSGDNKEGK